MRPHTFTLTVVWQNVFLEELGAATHGIKAIAQVLDTVEDSPGEPPQAVLSDHRKPCDAEHMNAVYAKQGVEALLNEAEFGCHPGCGGALQCRVAMADVFRGGVKIPTVAVARSGQPAGRRRSSPPSDP